MAEGRARADRLTGALASVNRTARSDATFLDEHAGTGVLGGCREHVPELAADRRGHSVLVSCPSAAVGSG